MKHFFGYEVEDPCPHCGSPRVGIDRDDAYSIVPGELVHVGCGWRKPSHSYMGQFGEHDAWLAAYADMPPDRRCPECGAELVVDKEKAAYRDGAFFAHCEPRIKLRSLPGCNMCKRHNEHFGILSE